MHTQRAYAHLTEGIARRELLQMGLRPASWCPSYPAPFEGG
jgi:hypothetical protein